jgi:hypothetical protein
MKLNVTRKKNKQKKQNTQKTQNTVIQRGGGGGDKPIFFFLKFFGWIPRGISEYLLWRINTYYYHISDLIGEKGDGNVLKSSGLT